jgi:hypothetical protein
MEAAMTTAHNRALGETQLMYLLLSATTVPTDLLDRFTQVDPTSDDWKWDCVEQLVVRPELDEKFREALCVRLDALPTSRHRARAARSLARIAAGADPVTEADLLLAGPQEQARKAISVVLDVHNAHSAALSEALTRTGTPQDMWTVLTAARHDDPRALVVRALKRLDELLVDVPAKGQARWAVNTVAYVESLAAEDFSAALDLLESLKCPAVQAVWWARLTAPQDPVHRGRFTDLGVDQVLVSVLSETCRGAVVYREVLHMLQGRTLTRALSLAQCEKLLALAGTARMTSTGGRDFLREARAILTTCHQGLVTGFTRPDGITARTVGHTNKVEVADWMIHTMSTAGPGRWTALVAMNDALGTWPKLVDLVEATLGVTAPIPA